MAKGKLSDFINRNELKEASTDARRWSRFLLLGLVVLTLLLGALFVWLPLRSSSSTEAEFPKELSLTWRLENNSNIDWKNVRLNLEGVTAPPEQPSDPSKLLARTAESPEDGYVDFFVGDVPKGESRNVTVYIVSETPGEFEYVSTFTAQDGIETRLPETHKLVF